MLTRVYDTPPVYHTFHPNFLEYSVITRGDIVYHPPPLSAQVITAPVIPSSMVERGRFQNSLASSVCVLKFFSVLVGFTAHCTTKCPRIGMHGRFETPYISLFFWQEAI